MGKSSHSINLLKRETRTFLDDFIDWALTIGRVLIIATEGIALAVFLYRFSLDRQIIDLRDKIHQKQVVVDLLKNNETIYRNLQDRLLLAKKFGGSAHTLEQRLESILAEIPPRTVVRNTVVSVDTVRIDADMTSTASLSDFVKALQATPFIQAVSVDKIENKPSEAILAVTLTATIKK